MNPMIRLQKAALPLLIGLALGWFEFSPTVQAIVPAPDGCYPNYTTAEGCNALNFLTTGAGNTGIGWYSLFSNTDASFNTGVGSGALTLNNGDSNTAVGAGALLLNTTGPENTAVGTDALVYNNGENNTAVGAFALFNNTDARSNTALGNRSLFANTTGINNTATGYRALGSNIDGFANTASGTSALDLNTSGSLNTAAGFSALSSNTEGASNTAIGFSALSDNTTGDLNTALGRNAGSNITGSGNVCIGADVDGEAGVDNSTYLRNVNTTEQAAGKIVAYVTVRLTDNRIGHEPIIIRSAPPASQKTAEELKSAVARHEATIAQLKKSMEVLTTRLEQQTTQIRKMSAQLDAGKGASQMVLKKR